MRHLWLSESLTPFPDHKFFQEARPGAEFAKNQVDQEQETHMPVGRGS